MKTRKPSEHFMMPGVQFLLTTNAAFQNLGHVYSKDDTIIHHLLFQAISLWKLQYTPTFYGFILLFGKVPTKPFLRVET